MRLLFLGLCVAACSGAGRSSGGGLSGETAGGSKADDPGSQAIAVPRDTGETDGSAGGEDLDMKPTDFECLLRWDKVRQFRITNKLGHTEETLAVASSPTGGTFPVGTVIQLIPGEASVKRARGWSTQTNDWEFFSLSTSSDGTTIRRRGTTDVVNQFNGNCFTCHSKAAPQWDFLCEKNHGCDPIPLSDATVDFLQKHDPRCP